MKRKTPKAKYHTVMLVDDNEVDNFINQGMIAAFHFAENVLIFTSGKSALEFMKNIDKNIHLMQSAIPDYMLLDISMPVIDGFQFLSEFEKLNNKILIQCKIAILTSSLNPSDRQRSARSKYIVAFVNKPLTVRSLEKL